MFVHVVENNNHKAQEVATTAWIKATLLFLESSGGTIAMNDNYKGFFKYEHLSVWLSHTDRSKQWCAQNFKL